MAGKENRWLVLGDSDIVNFGPIDIVRAMSNPLSPPTCMISSAVCVCATHSVLRVHECVLYMYMLHVASHTCTYVYTVLKSHIACICIIL